MVVLPCLSLCTGSASLEKGLALALPALTVQPVLYVEREAFAASYLASEMAGGTLARAPLYSDLRDLPTGVLSELRKVDPLLVTAGFPCQPFSTAGKRGGRSDTRWLWPNIDAILQTVEAHVVLLENVRGLVNNGLQDVLSTFAELGLDAEWGCYTAAQAGAPHKRERLFILGMAHGMRKRLQEFSGRHHHDRYAPRRLARRRSTTQMANTNSNPIRLKPKRHQRQTRQEPAPISKHTRTRTTSKDALGTFPPPPHDAHAWLHVLKTGRWNLLPALPATTQPTLCRMAHGTTARRADLLRLHGNSVIPQQVAYALNDLLQRV